MVLLYSFVLVVIVNCVYFLLFSKFSFLKASDKNDSEDYPVSLIICAKNEAENLKKHIPLWLEQEYPNFEIILINDASIDDTLEIIESFSETDSRIQIVNVVNNEAFWGNKKYALTLGIKRAKNKRMLFTDADCRPSSKQWLRLMSKNFSEAKQLILGYGAYEGNPGMLNRLIRYETLLTAVQYFSYAIAGIPYMGVGRNLGYSSDLYFANNGFMSHMKIPSGDDDLFVNEAATSKNTAICFNKNAFTYSIPKQTWKAWKIQKKRHLTTSRLYQAKHKFLLGTYYLFNLLFWALSITCLVVLDWKIPVLLIVFRFLIQYIIIGKAASKLKEQNLIPYIPFLDLFLVFIQMSIFISNSFSKPIRWK
jgi:glycosyltransferase involved in cell wall biosynthesis